MADSEPKIVGLLNSEKQLGSVGSPSDTFEATVDVLEVSEKSKLLGELVCFIVEEGDGRILVLGQIIEIRTENRWHQEPSFKGIIKRHGKLPNLSEVADNRIAKIGVQSSFRLSGDSEKHQAHKLANSPSTGVPVRRISDGVMKELMNKHQGLVCLGNAYDTNVSVPFWFEHFGSRQEGGGGDAYHIGVFGRTGSGKTATAANMILGYARHHKHMSILILDPQEQFYEDNNVLPDGAKFQKKAEELGMCYSKHKVPEEVILPDNEKLFSKLLLDCGFIRKAFNIHTPEKRKLMAESIQEYMEGRRHQPKFSIATTASGELLNQMIKRFSKDDKDDRDNKYLKNVYAKGQYLENLKRKIIDMDKSKVDDTAKGIWDYVHGLFRENGDNKKLEDLVKEVVCKPGNITVLNISGRNIPGGMESTQVFFVKIIEDAIKEMGAKLYANGKQANCLIVLDEAHRFINTYVDDQNMKELTGSIIDAVRTTRKYGIGYMFITQTIESLHKEIRRQTRIFAFGYGLTSGDEFKKIKDVINDDAGAKFYRSFIDPASNNKFPFMFYGPISPLSFTGAPLFLEMKKEITDFPPAKPAAAQPPGADQQGLNR